MEFFGLTLPAGWGIAGTILVVIDAILRIVAIAVVPYNRRPASAMAWLLLIMIVPIPGWIIYSILGNTRLPKGRRLRQALMLQALSERVADITDERDPTREDAQLTSILRLNRSLTAMPHLGGNDIRFISEFDDQIAQMVGAIDRAEVRVHIEFYLMVDSPRTSEFFAALERARARGVEVRVLIDHVTAIRYPRSKETRRRLERMGAELHYMMPLRPWRGQWQRPDLRNHRKLVVIDGRLGFFGSLNLIDPTYLWKRNLRRNLEWRDLWVEARGPLATELDAIFGSDWWLETEEILELIPNPLRPGSVEASLMPSGPGFDGEVTLRVFGELTHAATDRIIIVSPYFVPDESMSYAITSAALRGVHVELYASAIGDQFWTFHAQRSYYEMLLRAGVRIFLYEEPTVLHSKFMIFDDHVAIVGSANIDMRSFLLNFEVSAITEGREAVAGLEHIAAQYRAHSHELTLEEWLERPMRMRIVDNIARLTSALQ